MAKLVSKTYGQALFDLAVEEKKLDQIVEEVSFIREVLEKNKELVILLNHPKITIDEKVNVVENIFKNNISNIMTGFLVLIVNKRRNSQLEGIFEYFEGKVKDYKNIGVVSVTSAVGLTEEQKKRLMERLLQLTSFEKLEMKYLVEPEIIGGLIIRIKDRVVDNSVRTKLNNFAKDLSKIQLS